jgi:myo-inositol-1(or 4)-monophosphatase
LSFNLGYSVGVSKPSFLTVAIQAAQAAAKIHQFYAGGDLDINTKSSHTDLVTKVDKLSEEKIREIILSHFPEHMILGEEEGQSQGNASHRWIVDPLDGTMNYAHGFPFYSVSIALEVNGELEVGVVLDSVRNEMFYASKGQGAFCNGAPIKVSGEASLKRSLLSTGFPTDPATLQENIDLFAKVHPSVRAIRRPGSAALDLSYIACGRLDGFWELKLSPWDVAAGIMIIQEAGGTVSGPTAAPYQLGENTVVASNGHIHGKLLHLLDIGQTLA